jgi:glycerophosphoryl diester phosphodiesterase
VYAHRGGAALRPENTIASFDHGLALGADGLELDVHLSRDGVVVVHHDDTLDRTTGGSGPVSSLTAEELAAVDAGYWFRPRPAAGSEPAAADGTEEARSAGAAQFPFRGRGLGVPRLREVLDRYPGVAIIIELKANRPELATRTIDVVRAAGAIDHVSLGSFGWRVLHAARTYEPRIPTGASQEEARWALYRSWVGWPLGRPSYRELQVPEYAGGTTIISPRFIAHAHRAQIPVKVWTVDDPADMHRLIGWGVDALISDRPDVAVAAVGGA